MTRIALMIPTLDRSGAEKQFSLLAAGLPRAEFQVHAIALTRGGPFEEPLREAGIPLTILNKRHKFDPAAFWRLKHLLADLQPDILHTWLFAANAYGRLVAGGKPRPRVIVSERCVDTWKAGWQLWLDRRQMPRTHRLVGNSEAVAEFYQSQGFPAERITVIPNGQELPAAVPDEQLAALRRELDIPPDGRIVGYIGRLAPQKRVNDLVWAMELLRHLNDDVYFVLAGDGPSREEIRTFARETHCEQRIRFLGHREDVRPLFALLDVFWIASDFEGMSNSIMEAMAAGVPVVASDIPPNRELVVHGETGFLVPVGDRGAYNQYADHLLHHPELAHRLGAAGRQRIQSEFSVQKMVDSYAGLYREVLAGFEPQPVSAR